MQTVRTKAELQDKVKAFKAAGQTVAFVPTMGALHAGHLSLVNYGKNLCDRVVASVFVNPKQFGPNEDYASYPRQESSDMEKLRTAGVDMVYMPEANAMFPEHFTTKVHVGEVSEGLCSVTRPHFFDGVATVVAKLLLRVMPDIAIFGEKDYQQLTVIKRMVRDLDIPVEIKGAAIVREVDGLAMSSRNVYLNAQQRKIAPRIYEVLCDAAEKMIAEPGRVAQHLTWARAVLEDAGFDKVDYIELRDEDYLHPLALLDKSARLFVAAYLGQCRLIDNIAVEPADIEV